MDALMSVGLVLAQVAPEAREAAGAAEVSSSLWELVLKGGPMMIPIGLASLVALGVVVERLAVLRRRHVIPPGFLAGLRQTLEAAGGEPRAGIEYCKKHESPMARICAAGLGRAGRPLELIEKRITEQGEQEIMHLRTRLRVLSVIASVAPLLGLTGTILGMIAAFQTVAYHADALGKTEQLAGGIYEAMVTTAAGLLVAIPALIFYHLLASRIERLVAEMDRASIAFVEEWLEGPVSGRGHSARATDNGDAPLEQTPARVVAVGADDA